MNKDELNKGFYKAWHKPPMEKTGEHVSEFIETIPGWQNNQYLNNCNHWARTITLAGGPDHVYPAVLGFVTGAWERFIQEYKDPVEDDGLEGA